MKTSNKTNRRFSGIAVLMMVLSLVTVNLSAQKSYNNNSLANLSYDFISSIKNEILEAISESNAKYMAIDEEPIEDWMINPTEWTKKETPVTEVNFSENEMILEDWMMKANWENNSLMEEELLMEDWMMSVKWENSNKSEDDLQLEDWMTNPSDWACAK